MVEASSNQLQDSINRLFYEEWTQKLESHDDVFEDDTRIVT